MHELERHNLILLSVQQRPVLTVPELCKLTGASEATIRRDIISLDQEQKLRRVRGGVEAIHPPPFIGLAGRNFSINEHLRVQYKKAIAKKACELCQNGEKYGIDQKKVFVEDKDRCTFDLDNGHWSYGYQIQPCS